MEHVTPRTSAARATLVVVGLFVGGVTCGSLAGAAAAARAHDPYVALDLFARVLTTIEREHVHEISTDQLVEAAIRGMVRELDGQSQWLSAERYQQLQDDTEGAVTGIGLEVRPTTDGFEVTRVLPNSPALRDGIAAGDRILAVDGQPLDGLTPRALEDRFAGARGAPAVLTILRAGADAPEEVQTVRDRIPRPSVQGDLLPPSVAYLRLAVFHAGAGDELKLEFGRLERRAVGEGRTLDGLILDLRDNPGGLLSEAVAVADLFLDEGTIVSTRRRRTQEGQHDDVHVATPGGLPPGLPVAVLVNGGSASASEIVAAALQETGRAALVGEPTFGKGTVQQLYKNVEPAPSALKLTVGWYTTHSGEPVAPGVGRSPDHLVPSPTTPTLADELQHTLAEIALGDPERARLQALIERLPPEAPAALPIAWDLAASERLSTDPQLAAAVALLSE